jgi:non-canonical (house-cleaning) NTP pyrophosphatase
MKTIIVASRNPVKVRAAREGFARIFPGEEFSLGEVSVPSGVADQPFTSLETLQGAYNRALAAREAVPGADYWVGIEGGVEAFGPGQPGGPLPAGLVGRGEKAPSAHSHAGSADEQQAEPTAQAAAAQPLLAAFAWVVVLDRARAGQARTGTFFLPPRVAALVRAGKELGEADDIVFGRSNSKQENGAVGLLTGDALDRAGFYEPAVLLALIPFKNPELYG